jgi:xanthine dehydrogenase accessory factor
MLADPSTFDFLAERAGNGVQTALVTVTDVTGASVRNPGAHMAVDEHGEFVGSLSGGCIEAAVVSEARLAIDAGACRQLRFGAGSPMIDIRLPCGGRVDLLISPVVGGVWPSRVQTSLRLRNPVRLNLPTGPQSVELSEGANQFSAAWQSDGFVVNHLPRMRINVVGHGGSVLALAQLARAIAADIQVYSPDPALIVEAAAMGIAATLLKTAADVHALRLDPWTATIFYFHDHEWEPPLMAAALSGSGFFVGAMGSRKTQEARRQTLLEFGVPCEAIDRLRAPIGLFHSSRDPATLALSTLGQIVQVYHSECVE